MSSSTNKKVTQKVQVLLREALDLLTEVMIPPPAMPDALVPPAVSHKLEVSAELKTLLNHWIHVHHTQWIPHCAAHPFGNFGKVEFETALNEERASVAKWMLMTQKVFTNITDVFYSSVSSMKTPLFVCQIAKECGFSPNDNTVANFAVSTAWWAAKAGNTAALTFLKDWGLNNDGVRAFCSSVLDGAVQYGQIEVLHFLTSAWDFNIKDARRFDRFVVRLAAKHGQIEVLKFFKEVWGITVDDVRAMDNNALQEAVANGHLPTVRFMRETWGLNVWDVRTHGDRALERAVRGGHTDLILYLTNWMFNASTA